MELSDETRTRLREQDWYKRAMACAEPFLAAHDTVTRENLTEYGKSLGPAVTEDGDTLVFDWGEGRPQKVTFTDTGYVIRLSENHDAPEMAFDNLNVVHYLSGRGE